MDFLGKRLVHTPEGVRDIYGAEYANKRNIEALFSQKLHSFGYQDIQTPTFEFFDVFSNDIGTIAPLFAISFSLYKVKKHFSRFLIKTQ